MSEGSKDKATVANDVMAFTMFSVGIGSDVVLVYDACNMYAGCDDQTKDETTSRRDERKTCRDATSVEDVRVERKGGL